jgi:hypothetical protein
MPGMMPPQEAPPPAAGAAPQQGMVPAPAEPPQGEPASPEEQQMYDDFVTRAKMLIFDQETEEVRPAVVKMLEGDDDPKAALGQTAASIAFRVLQEAEKGGVQIPEDVMMEAGQEIFSDVAQVASAVTGVDFMADDQAYEGAFYIAVDELRQMLTSAGMVDVEQEKAAFQEMAAADADGRLSEMMGGLQQ